MVGRVAARVRTQGDRAENLVSSTVCVGEECGRGASYAHASAELVLARTTRISHPTQSNDHLRAW